MMKKYNNRVHMMQSTYEGTSFDCVDTKPYLDSRSNSNIRSNYPTEKTYIRFNCAKSTIRISINQSGKHHDYYDQSNQQIIQSKL